MGDSFLIFIYERLGMKLTLALAVLCTLIFLLILISIIQKIFKKKGNKKENIKKKTQKINLNTISAESPRQELILLDKKVRAYFKAKLNSESEMTYSEIIKKLKEKNKSAPVGFCKEMNYHLYSEKSTSKQEVRDMKRKFLNIIQPKKPLKAKLKIKPEKQAKVKPKPEEEIKRRIIKKYKKQIKRPKKKSLKKKISKK